MQPLTMHQALCINRHLKDWNYVLLKAVPLFPEKACGSFSPHSVHSSLDFCHSMRKSEVEAREGVIPPPLKISIGILGILVFSEVPLGAAADLRESFGTAFRLAVPLQK